MLLQTLPFAGFPGTRRIPMNRVTGLVLAGLVLLLGVILIQSQPAQAQLAAICPADGDLPTEPCDSEANCFHHCCLTSGLCPTSSCVDSLDAPDNARANCSGSCLDEVACSPFNPLCVPHDVDEHCLGTVVCKTANCDGRRAGSVCLYAGTGPNFKICEVSQ
jgi:hypothetical protein